MSLWSLLMRSWTCVYTSTLLLECGELGLKPVDVKESCLGWRLAYSEDDDIWGRLSTDFYITDKNSGIRALVKAGPDSELFHTDNREQTDTLRKVACLVYLAFAKEQRVMVITPPQELISTGCQWKKLLLPVDVDGLILAIP
ncbi:hypothetical protein HAX54_000527 [Datura stramonium]|uniref:Uncharacterized protein n=1 Tax=Datura stramonium TaxID=4076 RepID=A0ABS8WQ32_DATST|nr:hypothetical protein [Datura stramonium]